MLTISAASSERFLNPCHAPAGTTTIEPPSPIRVSPSTVTSTVPPRFTKTSSYGCRCSSAPWPVALPTTKKETLAPWSAPTNRAVLLEGGFRPPMSITFTRRYPLARSCHRLRSSPETGANGSVFEPFGDESSGRVDVHLPQPPRARVHELVRHAGRYRHDLSAGHLDHVVSGGEGGGALLDQEDLVVGAAVQPRAAPRRRVYDDDGDPDPEVVALE